MPTYKYNRDLEFALCGIQDVHAFFFTPDRAYCRNLTPTTAKELLAYIQAITFCRGNLNHQVLPLLGLQYDTQVMRMVQSLIAHSPHYIKSGCLTTRVDLIDAEAEMFIPEAHEGQLIAVHPTILGEGHNFGLPSHSQFEVRMRQDRNRSAIELEFHFTGFPTPKAIVQSIIEFIRENQIYGIIKGVKHVAHLWFNDEEAIQPIFGIFQAAPMAIKKNLIVSFPSIWINPYNPTPYGPIKNLNFAMIAKYTDKCLAVVKNILYQDRNAPTLVGIGYNVDIDPSIMACPCGNQSCYGFTEQSLCKYLPNFDTANTL